MLLADSATIEAGCPVVALFLDTLPSCMKLLSMNQKVNLESTNQVRCDALGRSVLHRLPTPCQDLAQLSPVLPKLESVVGVGAWLPGRSISFFSDVGQEPKRVILLPAPSTRRQNL